MQSQISKAIELLNQNEVVGIPTETVYGLAARIDRESALQKIFSTKSRPFFDPLIVHVSSVEQAKSLVLKWPKAAEALANQFWPGPLTLVLPKNNLVSSLITSGLTTVALRMPNHPIALEILTKLNCPLAAPSANKFGKTSPTTAQHVTNEFQAENVFVVDGGPCQIGLESTVLLIQEEANLTQLSILRAGAITKSQIEKSMQSAFIPFEFIQASKAASPGHMQHHYMPNVPFVLLQQEPENRDNFKAILLQKLNALPEQIEQVKIVKPKKLDLLATLELSSVPEQAARQFYAELRRLAEKKPDLIYFVITKEMNSEPWAALLDRMSKAASLSL